MQLDWRSEILSSPPTKWCANTDSFTCWRLPLLWFSYGDYLDSRVEHNYLFFFVRNMNLDWQTTEDWAGKLSRDNPRRRHKARDDWTASEVVSAVLTECWLDWDTDGQIVATSLEISTVCVATLSWVQSSSSPLSGCSSSSLLCVYTWFWVCLRNVNSAGCLRVLCLNFQSAFVTTIVHN